MMRPLLLSIAFFVTGTLFGLVLGRSDTRPMETSAEAKVVSANPPVLDHEVASEQLASIGNGSENERLAAPVGPADLVSRETELDRALTDLATRFPPRSGDEVLVGRVVDQNGGALAGIEVVVTGPHGAWAQADSGRDSSNVGRAYSGRVQQFGFASVTVKRIIGGLAPIAEVLTDEDGRFEAAGLTDGTFSVMAYAEDLHFAAVTAHPGQPVELVGRPVFTIDLDVVRADGSAPTEAFIAIDSAGRDRGLYNWTPDAASLRLTSTAVTLQGLAGRVHPAGNGQFRADERSDLVMLDALLDGRGPHTLQLSAFPSVHVKVTANADTTGPFKPWCDLVRGVHRVPVEAGNDGVFRAFDVTAGPYVVEVGRGDGPAEITRNIAVETGSVELDLELGALDSSRYLVLHCVDDAGRSVQDIGSFGLAIQTSRSSVSTHVWTRARPGGEYWISLERDAVRGLETLASGASIVSIRIDAGSSSLGNQSIDLDGTERRAKIVFPGRCDCLVQVDGVLTDKLEVFAEVQRDQGGGWSRARQPAGVQANGQALLKALPRGTVRCVLAHADSRQGVRLDETVVEIQPGRNRATLTAPPVHDLAVSTPGRPNQRFKLMGWTDSGLVRLGSEISNAREQLLFRSLKPGRYRLVTQESGAPEFFDLEVPTPEVEFHPAELRGYEVTGLDAGSYAESVGLRLGDVIVAFGGMTADHEHFLALVRAPAMRRAGPTFAVERGSERLEIPAKADQGDGSSSGQFGANLTAMAR